MIQIVDTWIGFFLFCINKVNSTWEAEQEHPKTVHPKRKLTQIRLRRQLKLWSPNLKKSHNQLSICFFQLFFLLCFLFSHLLIHLFIQLINIFVHQPCDRSYVWGGEFHLIHEASMILMPKSDKDTRKEITGNFTHYINIRILNKILANKK